MPKTDPRDRAANAVVTELQELVNILVARCAKHSNEKAEIAAARDAALESVKALGAEVEALKSAAPLPEIEQ